jgi:hypothetical protein
MTQFPQTVAKRGTSLVATFAVTFHDRASLRQPSCDHDPRGSTCRQQFVVRYVLGLFVSRAEVAEGGHRTLAAGLSFHVRRGSAGAIVAIPSSST